MGQISSLFPTVRHMERACVSREGLRLTNADARKSPQIQVNRYRVLRSLSQGIEGG